MDDKSVCYGLFGGFIIGVVVNLILFSIVVHTFNPCELCGLRGMLWI